MTVKLTASWDIQTCDDCGKVNDTELEFPPDWTVLVSAGDNGELEHEAFCPDCHPRLSA